MIVFLFAINISSDIELPGVEIPSVHKRRKALCHSHQILPLAASQTSFDYPVEIPDPTDSTTDEQETQSTIWPLAKPNKQLLLNFLVYQDTQATLSSMNAESTRMSTTSTAMMP